MTLSTVGPGPYGASLALALVLGFPTWLLNRPQAEPISHPLSPHHTEIIERVTRGEQPPFRPSLALQSHLEELGQLMQRCWAEDPQERPPFQQIRLMLRKFNRSLALVLGRPSLLHPRQPPCIPHLSLIPVVAEPMHSPPDISCSSPPQPRSPLCEYRRTQLSPQPPTFHTSLLPGPFSTVFTGKQSKWPSTSSLCLSVLPGSSHPPIDPLSQLLCGGQSPRHTP